jgi:hypothetical protein
VTFGMATRQFGVLLITVWSEGAVPVARLRGFRGDGDSTELAPAAGRAGILAAVASWLGSVELPTDSGEGTEGVTNQ